MLFGASRHVVSLIRFPIMPDAVWCIPTRGITYSVSHHAGCCLVHPDTWYHLFGLPSCRMLFGASRHVVSLIRTRGITYSVSHHARCCLVHPDTWYHLFGLPSCRMLFGASRHVVSHFDLPSCRMLFGASRHVVSIKCLTPSRQMPIGASRQVGHFFNVIRHHDGCRLAHPAKWDI